MFQPLIIRKYCLKIYSKTADAEGANSNEIMLQILDVYTFQTV